MITIEEVPEATFMSLVRDSTGWEARFMLAMKPTVMPTAGMAVTVSGERGIIKSVLEEVDVHWGAVDVLAGRRTVEITVVGVPA
jgi:hypothetical protein